MVTVAVISWRAYPGIYMQGGYGACADTHGVHTLGYICREGMGHVQTLMACIPWCRLPFAVICREVFAPSPSPSPSPSPNAASGPFIGKPRASSNMVALTVTLTRTLTLAPSSEPAKPRASSNTVSTTDLAAGTSLTVRVRYLNPI